MPYGPMQLFIAKLRPFMETTTRYLLLQSVLFEYFRVDKRWIYTERSALCWGYKTVSSVKSNSRETTGTLSSNLTHNTKRSICIHVVDTQTLVCMCACLLGVHVCEPLFEAGGRHKTVCENFF